MERWYSYDYFIDYETEATLGHFNTASNLEEVKL